MSDRSGAEVDVSIVGNPSLSIEKAIVTLTNKSFGCSRELASHVYKIRCSTLGLAFGRRNFLARYRAWVFRANGKGLSDHFPRFKRDRRALTQVRALCRGEPHRIYWRVTELDYLPISGYIGLKGALNMMCKPRIYVILDEPTFMFTEFSDDKFNKSAKKSALSEVSMNDVDEYDASSLLRELEESYDSINLTDIEILRCAARCQSNETRLHHDCLISRSPPTYTRENSNVDRQLNLLMKGFPEAKATRPVEIPFAETKNISSAGTGSRGGAKKK